MEETSPGSVYDHYTQPTWSIFSIDELDYNFSSINTSLTTISSSSGSGTSSSSSSTRIPSYSTPDNDRRYFDTGNAVVTAMILNISNVPSAEGNGSNSSSDDESIWDGLWRGIPLGIVLVFLCLLTTAGNIMVLHAVRTEKRLQTVSNLFIVSLAVADVIVGIIVMPVSAFYIFSEKWLLGLAVCQIWIGVDYIASTASILNLFILSLDRYWSVRQPLKYLHKRTKRRALSMIAFVWAVSSLWVIPVTSWHYFAHGGVRTVPSHVCDTEYAKNSVFKVITAFFNFYLPLTVMYILYLRIFIAIRRRSEFELGQRNPGGAMLAYKSKVSNNCGHSAEDSECNEEISSLDVRITSGVTSSSSIPRSRQNGTRQQQIQAPRRDLRLMAMNQKASRSSCVSAPPPSFKVEYIYDESVLDPQTEKIERYFYEDHYQVQRGDSQNSSWVVTNADKFTSDPDRSASGLRAPRHLGEFKVSPKFQLKAPVVNSFPKAHSPLQNKNASSSDSTSSTKRGFFFRREKKNCNNNKKLPIRLESYRKYREDSPTTFAAVSDSSSSSASTFDDRDNKRHGTANKKVNAGASSGGNDTGKAMNSNKSSRETYSITSGIRKIRQAETFIDRTVGLTVSVSGPSGDSGMSRVVPNDSESTLGITDLHDEKNRRLTGGVLGLKERLKTIRQSSSLNKEIKAARQLGVIMGAFTICFLPYFILFLVVAFCDNCIGPGHLTAATWVGYLNSTLNPFLYPLCNANFRTKFRSMLRCCGGKRGRLRNAKNDNSERNTAFNSRYD